MLRRRADSIPGRSRGVWPLTSPFVGGGFETFTPELFQRYATTATDVHGPHSIYFGVLAEHGFPGLILYLLLVLSCLASLHRVIKWARFRGDQRAIDYADMLRLSIVAFLVSGVFWAALTSTSISPSWPVLQF